MPREVQSLYTENLFNGIGLEPKLDDQIPKEEEVWGRPAP
jgi:hypothetical protein